VGIEARGVPGRVRLGGAPVQVEQVEPCVAAELDGLAQAQQLDRRGHPIEACPEPRRGLGAQPGHEAPRRVAGLRRTLCRREPHAQGDDKPAVFAVGGHHRAPRGERLRQLEVAGREHVAGRQGLAEGLHRERKAAPRGDIGRGLLRGFGRLGFGDGA
jgi:hypothetical protein